MEEWRSVVGYEGFYEVSDLGRVRSVDGRIARDGRKFPGVILKSSYCGGKASKRYLGVSLSNGERKTEHIHVLVLKAFCGECPQGMEGCHNSGDVNDNSLSNLRWDSHSGNMIDRENHGTARYNPRKGVNHKDAVLNETDVERIKDLIINGCSQRAVAAWMGVSRGAITGIVYGTTWRHLQGA